MEEEYSDSLIREPIKPDTLRRLAYGVTYSCFCGFALGETLGMVAGTIWELPFFMTLIIANSISLLFGFVFSLFPLLGLNIQFKKALSQALLSDIISLFIFESFSRFAFYTIPGASITPVTSILFWKVLLLASVASFVIALPINILMIQRKNFVTQKQ